MDSWKRVLIWKITFLENMEICLAPDIVQDKIGDYLEGKTGIQKRMGIYSPVKPSDYAGTVKFNLKDKLCKTCTNKS